MPVRKDLDKQYISYYNHHMLSHIVYLYGDKFAQETNMLHFRETLLNGKKVDQKKLAQQLVFAALVSLYQDKLINLFLEEGKILFIKTKTAKAKRLKDTDSLEGLEKIIFERIKGTENINDVVRLSLHMDENPWEQVTKMVRKIAEKTKLTDEEIEKMFHAYSATIKDIKNTPDLFSKIHDGIREGIERREEKESSDE